MIIRGRIQYWLIRRGRKRIPILLFASKEKHNIQEYVLGEIYINSRKIPVVVSPKSQRVLRLYPLAPLSEINIMLNQEAELQITRNPPHISRFFENAKSMRVHIYFYAPFPQRNIYAYFSTSKDTPQLLLYIPRYNIYAVCKKGFSGYYFTGAPAIGLLLETIREKKTIISAEYYDAKVISLGIPTEHLLERALISISSEFYKGFLKSISSFINNINRNMRYFNFIQWLSNFVNEPPSKIHTNIILTLVYLQANGKQLRRSKELFLYVVKTALHMLGIRLSPKFLERAINNFMKDVLITEHQKIKVPRIYFAPALEKMLDIILSHLKKKNIDIARYRPLFLDIIRKENIRDPASICAVVILFLKYKYHYGYVYDMFEFIASPITLKARETLLEKKIIKYFYVLS